VWTTRAGHRYTAVPSAALPAAGLPAPGGCDPRTQAMYQALIDLAELTDPGGYQHPTLHLIGTDPTDRNRPPAPARKKPRTTPPTDDPPPF